jgi:hypothetical protein
LFCSVFLSALIFSVLRVVSNLHPGIRSA